MAPLIMPKLGEPQTCSGPCEHRDCAYWRQIVGKACVLCSEPVDSGQRFYFHHGPKRIRVLKGPPPSEVLRAPSRGGDHDVMHALCYEESDLDRPPGRTEAPTGGVRP